MIEMIDIGFEDAVAYRLAGKITTEEMKKLFDLFRAKIEKGEELLVYQEVESFGGIELDAIVEKLKFLKEFGLSNFSKIAVVTPKKWLHKLVDLEDKLFRSVDMKGFSLEDKEAAVSFLRAS